MKKLFTLSAVLLFVFNATQAQLAQTCYNENFSVQTTGWTYSQGAGEGSYNSPGTGCTPNRGITTPGVGGNNPAVITTPFFTSSGAVTLNLAFDIYCVGSNLSCNSWKDFDCPTSIDVFYYVGATKHTGITDLVLPANGPLNSPTVNFNFDAGSNLPIGTQYKLEIVFKPKSGIGNCVQPGTKYILDNFKNCEISCNNCTIDAINDVFCSQTDNSNTFNGNLATNDLKYQGAVVTYSLSNGPFANGSSVKGGANLVIQPDGNFSITRTDLTKSSFEFTYKVSEQLLGLSDLASVKVCFPVGGPLPIFISDFSAIRKNINVVLNWKTSSEINASGFEVERMSGSRFISVGFVKAADMVNGAQYSFTEQNSLASLSEYRLKLVDKDGQFKYSETRVVKGMGASVDFVITGGAGKLNVFPGDISQAYQVELFDVSGRMIRTLKTSNSVNIQINGLQSGLMMVRLTGLVTGETITKKCIVF